MTTSDTPENIVSIVFICSSLMYLLIGFPGAKR
jgi:hypothetical protein